MYHIGKDLYTHNEPLRHQYGLFRYNGYFLKGHRPSDSMCTFFESVHSTLVCTLVNILSIVSKTKHFETKVLFLLLNLFVLFM